MPLNSPRQSAVAFDTVHPARYQDLRNIVKDGRVEEVIQSLAEWIREDVDVTNNIMQGKINATGTITLNSGAAVTTLSSVFIGSNTKVFLTPTTANAAAELTSLYLTYPNAVKEKAVINHANTAAGDKTFEYALLG